MEQPTKNIKLLWVRKKHSHFNSNKFNIIANLGIKHWQAFSNKHSFEETNTVWEEQAELIIKRLHGLGYLPLWSINTLAKEMHFRSSYWKQKTLKVVLREKLN